MPRMPSRSLTAKNSTAAISRSTRRSPVKTAASAAEAVAVVTAAAVAATAEAVAEAATAAEAVVTAAAETAGSNDPTSHKRHIKARLVNRRAFICKAANIAGTRLAYYSRV